MGFMGSSGMDMVQYVAVPICCSDVEPEYSEEVECEEMVACGCQPPQETVEYMDENGCVTSCMCVDMEGSDEKEYSDDMVCPEDAYLCEDGTVVTRNPYMNCEFDECPDYSDTGDMSYDECKEMVVCGCQPPMETVEYMDEM